MQSFSNSANLFEAFGVLLRQNNGVISDIGILGELIRCEDLKIDA